MHSFQRLQILDVFIIDKICNSLKSAYNPALSKYFIYQEENFRSYFLTLLSNPDAYIFYCLNGSSNQLIGFVFFEVEKSIIHLRNIIIDHDFNDYNIGEQLFFKSFEVIKSEHSEIAEFQLETFAKNTGALKWYKHLGMAVSHHLNWYDISALFKVSKLTNSQKNSNSEIALNVDPIGFTQLLYKEEQIGTLINNKNLVIKAELTPKLLRKVVSYFNSLPLSSVCLISRNELDFSLIDRSVILVSKLMDTD